MLIDQLYMPLTGYIFGMCGTGGLGLPYAKCALIAYRFLSTLAINMHTLKRSTFGESMVVASYDIVSHCTQLLLSILYFQVWLQRNPFY